MIPSSIPNPGVPLVEVYSGVGVDPATIPDSGVSTGSTVPESPTCPSIMKVENPGVADEYWKYPPAQRYVLKRTVFSYILLEGRSPL